MEPAKKKRTAATTTTTPKDTTELKKIKKTILEPKAVEELDLTLLNISDRNLSIPSNTVQSTSEKLNPTEFYLYFDL